MILMYRQVWGPLAPSPPIPALLVSCGQGAEEGHGGKKGRGGSCGGKWGQSAGELTNSLLPAKQVAVEEAQVGL